MFKSILNLFKRQPKTTSAEVKQATGDSIRKYAKTTYVTPARQRGEQRVTFSAAELQRGLNQRARVPLVCSAIDAKKFEEFARVKLVKREGDKQGASARWTFKVL
jgi:hypothetical protein